MIELPLAAPLRPPLSGVWQQGQHLQPNRAHGTPAWMRAYLAEQQRAQWSEGDIGAEMERRLAKRWPARPSTKAQILRLIQADPRGLTNAQIQRCLHLRSGTVATVTCRLLRRGQIVRTKPGPVYCYTLPGAA